MSIYNQKLFRLLLIALTVLVLYAYRFFPEKRYSVLDDPSVDHFVYSVQLPDGQPMGTWINQQKNEFRCFYSADIPDYVYYCSYNLGYKFGPNMGIDLSSFDRIELDIKYEGSAPKMRFFARNFSTKYSNRQDTNSAKYNAVYLSTKYLDRTIVLDVSEFSVMEWWLMAYNIPREESYPELDNIVNLGIDFSDSMTPGNHDVQVKKLDFVGVWITREQWYLAVFTAWLAAVFFSTLYQLRKMHKQKLVDENTIKSLNEVNSKLIRESDRFRKLSTVDALTQSYNRFGIDEIVTSLTDSAKHVEHGQPLFSIILLDIDHFKKVNDNRGHDVGDRVLKQVADVIRRNVRDGDYIGRWGGEEFVVVLPFTSQEFALAMAEKIRISLYSEMFEPHKPLVVTTSAGVGALRRGETFSEVLKRVDRALYNAKDAGRNCCLVAEKAPVHKLPR